MKRHEIIASALQVPVDAGIFFGAFFLARNIREVTDLIPSVQLPIQRISEDALWGFALGGTILFVLIQAIRRAYQYNESQSSWSTIVHTLTSSVTWFLFFTAMVYLGNEYLYTVEIPRLVIFFALCLGWIGVSIGRVLIHRILILLHQYSLLEKTKVGYIGDVSRQILDEYRTQSHIILVAATQKNLASRIRKREVDSIIFWSDQKMETLQSMIQLCKIYWVVPRIAQLPDTLLPPSSVEFIGSVPVTELHFVRITAWGRILKRCFDILASWMGILVFSPLLILIGLALYIEDPAGPIIYKNRRIGKDGIPFTLYKFRYMYWKYCVKDAYGVSPEVDEALALEKNLIASAKNSRTGPIYKITREDPRKMKVGALIERFSLDELPQLFNVLFGSMSLVGPRPHQPREVELYDEWHRQVLTIKPWITGMAQVYAREAKDFDQEVRLDTFYIENWNPLLDIRLLLGTLKVLFIRR
jgi:lipopolysaccharide/colanic/teichoic acid biosynthesis glycosyltransferase